MRIVRGRLPLVLVAAMVLATGSCSSDHTASSGASTSENGGVGQPIRDGFRVVDGSELICPAFPSGVAYFYKGRPVIDGGFRAMLEFRGDPRDVINGYLDQAQALGLTVGRGGGRDTNTSELVGRAGCANRDQDADWFICSGFARNDDEHNPRSLLLTFARGRVGDARPFSHLEMRYSTTPLYWDGAVIPVAPGVVGAPEDPVPVPEDLGSPSDDSTLFDDWPPVSPVEVLDGTEPVAEMTNFDCTAFTPLAVLDVTGDPSTIIAGYADQFSTIADSPPLIDQPLDVPGGQLHVAHASEAGGVEYTARLFETDQESWLLIESCYD